MAVFRIRIHLIRIRIQHFRLNTDPDLIRIQFGSRVLMTKNWEKFTAKKYKFFKFFFYFCGSFLSSWIRIRIPNPDTDPLSWLNPDPIQIRIRNTGLWNRFQNDFVPYRLFPECRPAFNWFCGRIRIQMYKSRRQIEWKMAIFLEFCNHPVYYCTCFPVLQFLGAKFFQYEINRNC